MDRRDIPEDAKQFSGEDFSWIPPPPETTGNRFGRKFRENPFVPIGCAATVAALTFGLIQFNRGNQAKSQLAMRLRVLAQGGTVIALVAGVFLSSLNSGKSQTPVQAQRALPQPSLAKPQPGNTRPQKRTNL